MMGFLFGRVRVSGEGRFTAKLLNLLMTYGISYESLSLRGGQIQFQVSERAFRRLAKLCDAEGICLTVEERNGLPQMVRRYGKRIGLLAGILLAAVVLFWGSRVVWDVRVTGNVVLADETVREMLSACGLKSGTYLPTLDTDLVESKMLLSHRELCWISVNIRGTTANVEVLETVSGDRETEMNANLVASCDGQIERIEVYEGNVTVKVGDVVREGDLLAGGIYDKGLLGVRITRAKGEIYARTVHSFEIEIPLESEEKVYTGREWTEKYVNFFGKRIKVFANTGNVGAECDIIYRDNGVSLPDGAVLPISLQSVIYREYRKELRTYGNGEAMEQAFSALAGELEAFVTKTGAELLSKTVRCELDESAFRIYCTVICVENIALVQEFDIN